MSRHNKQNQRGNAMLEFALASSLLVALFTGTFQFGYTFYVYNNLITAVRSGARYASVRDLSKASNSNSTPAAFADAVKNVVVYGTPTPTLNGTDASQNSQPVVRNLTTSNVVVEVIYENVGNTNTNYNPREVKVSLTNFTVDGVFRTFSFTGKPVLTMPYLGDYCALGETC